MHFLVELDPFEQQYLTMIDNKFHAEPVLNRDILNIEVKCTLRRMRCVGNAVLEVEKGTSMENSTLSWQRSMLVNCGRTTEGQKVTRCQVYPYHAEINLQGNMESDSDMAQRLQNEENTRGDSRTRRIPTRVQQMVSGILTITILLESNTKYI
tara:strand:- start:24 stop:482 length:459 start_codon:yes stop_codon:yes gene_type:complete